MKVFEILNFNREPLKRLQQAGIRIEDVEYIDLYNDYRVMLGGGEKGLIHCGDTCRSLSCERAQGVHAHQAIWSRV